MAKGLLVGAKSWVDVLLGCSLYLCLRVSGCVALRGAHKMLMWGGWLHVYLPILTP